MRILLIGDGIALHTGFATVLRHIADALVQRGDDVHQIACLDTPPDCDSRPYYDRGVTPHFPFGQGDLVGISLLDELIRTVRPACVLLNGDPGTMHAWLSRLDGIVPTVLYAPIEGAPVHPLLAQAFKRATRAVTYTQWAADQLRTYHHAEIPWVYHGVDTAVFQPLCPTERAQARRELGWEGLFVTAYVARNNGRKGHDRLLKALTQLPAHHRLYLHCHPVTTELGGWDLGFLSDYWGVGRRVDFSPQQEEIRGIPATDLARRLSAADLYVSASRMEGFGLPILEAMAAGLPVVVPADRGVQQEIAGDARYTLLPVRDWDTFSTLAQLASVHPFHIADAVTHVEAHPADAAAAGQRSRARALLPAFTWSAMTDRLLTAVDEAVA